MFIVALVVALASGGCAGRSASSKPRSSRATAAEWRAAINDWYDDGRFETRHSCEAVREALNRLATNPGPYNTAAEDLRRYARRVC